MRTLNFQIHDNIDDDHYDKLIDDLNNLENVELAASTSDRSKIAKYLLTVTLTENPISIIEQVSNHVEDKFLGLIIPCDEGDIIINEKLDATRIDEIKKTLQERDC